MLRWMDAVEAADVEGVTPGTVRRWGRQGKVERRVGGDGYEYLIDDPDSSEDLLIEPSITIDENQVSVQVPGAFMITTLVIIALVVVLLWGLL